MRSTIISLKLRIDKNKKELERKYILLKPVLKKMNYFIDNNISDEVIQEWLDDMDNVIFVIRYHLDVFEQKSKNKKLYKDNFFNNYYKFKF